MDEKNRGYRDYTEESNLPYSLEAEQAVLGAILMDPNCLNIVSDKLHTEHFYLPEHQAIYQAMLTCSLETGVAIDVVTVLEAVKGDKRFADEEESKTYLFKLAQTVPSLSNIENYATIVREKYDVRRLIRAARNITDACMDPANEASELIDSAEQQIYEIRQDRNVGGLMPIRQVMVQNYEMFRKLNSEERALYVGIPSGISALDNITTGLNRSDLIVVGARPGMGKTSFALNIARNVAVQQNRTVAIFNLEMSREQMVNRLLSTEARVSGKKLRTGNLSADEWTRMAAASDILNRAPIYLDETPTVTVQDMKARLRRLKPPAELLVVDYLQLMHTPKGGENRVQEVTEITRSLKILAKELGIPVLVCAQLRREAEKGRRPGLADLRESGSIEQDADQVLFLYREDYYANEKDDPSGAQAGISEVIVAKNRHGELGTVKLAWSGEFTQFSTLEVHQNEG